MAADAERAAREARRVARLRSYRILDELHDPLLNDYAEMAAQIAGTPLAMISLVDADWQFAKGSFGPVAPSHPRDEAFCARVVENPSDGLIVDDLSKDERFAKNKLVTGAPNFRFYAGMPLDGDAEGSIGTVCVLDTVPRRLTELQVKQLKLLSKAVMTRIEMRRMARRWEELTGEPVEAESWNSEGRSAKVGEIKRALSNGEFVNYYQPKVDLRTGRITGAEALIRWRHPERGLMQPVGFVSLMEQTGLIIEAGKAVLSRVTDDWHAWCAAGLSPPQIAVNVAARQFLCGTVVKDIASAHRRCGVGPGGSPLSIEVTESGLITDRDSISQQLRDIRAMGVPVALDDFGTGYSSLSYLATLPLDVLKIDRSFVMKMTKEMHYTTLVNSIVQLAHGLDLKVVAEGVETMEEAHLLKLLRCEEAQGYLYGKPMSAQDFTLLLLDNGARSSAFVTPT